MLEKRFVLTLWTAVLLSLFALGVAAPAASKLKALEKGSETKQAAVEAELEKLKNFHQGASQRNEEQPQQKDHSVPREEPLRFRQGSKQERVVPQGELPRGRVQEQAPPREDQQVPQDSLPSLGLQRQFYGDDREAIPKRWPMAPPEQGGGYYYETVNDPAAAALGGGSGGDYLPLEEDVTYNVRDLLRQGMIGRQEPSLYFPGRVTSAANRQLRLLESPEELRDEGTLEEIIYQLARDMFTQNLLRGEPSVEETFSRMASFLEAEVTFRRISRETEQKIMSIVSGALVDTLRDFPELLPEQPARKRDPSLAQPLIEASSLKNEQQPQPKKVWNKDRTAPANSTVTAA